MAGDSGSGDGVREPWYAAGLRFECRPDCGACCTNHGDFEYVYLEHGDVTRLARYLRLSAAEFRRRYTTVEDGWTLLRIEQPDCPFLEGTRCGVYEARPVQCRTFPFWEENLTSREKWRRLAEHCPGIDRGPRHDLLQIRSRLRARES